MIVRDGEAVFPLGMYEQPRNLDEWHEWRDSGINLLCCHGEDELDSAHKSGMMGWVPVPVITGTSEGEEGLAERIKSLRDHPAIVTWEAQDEAIWNACRLEDGKVTTRIREQSPELRKILDARLDAVVSGLERGSSIVRKLDPTRKIWLNEACKSDQETLSRCLPYLDAVGYDYYPIPEGPTEGRQMHLLGGYTDRFRKTAPSKDIWVVEQAFSWSNIRPESGRPETYPNVAEYRFMAWIAIAHGATGLLWWGSAHETRATPYIHGLMTVVSELGEVGPFLVAGNLPGVRAIPDERQSPPTLGVSSVARRSGDRTLLALINEDPYQHDVVVRGMDWIDPGDLSPMVEPSHELDGKPGELAARIEGHEVLLYATM